MIIRVTLKIMLNEIKEPDRSGKICSEEEILLHKKAAKLLRIDETSIEKVVVRRKSVDARKKDNICFTYSVDIKVYENIENSSKFKHNLLKLNGKVKLVNEKDKTFEPIISCSILKTDNNICEKVNHIVDDLPPVIVGAGPAGLFASYILALNGCKPLLIEQGNCIEKRVEQVERFWNNPDELNIYSNVSFGEGGAGTFSDGKLNTMVKGTFGRIEFVKKVFVENGAPEEILYLAKPHIGTDELRQVIVNIRKKIIALGGKVCFNTKMIDLNTDKSSITGIEIQNTNDLSTKNIKCRNLILANGHSARETYFMLKNKLKMEQKDFAIGLRIQHPQELINKDQYGEACDKLPPADYKLTYHSRNGRAVYSFCMCPGGYVVNASTENSAVAVNGMSNHSRSSENANSAIVASVTCDDFGSSDVLAGIEFQRRYEKKAFEAACKAKESYYETDSNNTCAAKNSAIPCQCYGDYKASIASKKPRGTKPVTKGQYIMTDLSEVLPVDIREAIIEGIDYFDTKLPGFGGDEAVLCGVETRTSSPVRIVRDETLQSDVKGIYPCGEGAGYAGGIMSAAVDGIKCAMAVLKS